VRSGTGGGAGGSGAGSGAGGPAAGAPPSARLAVTQYADDTQAYLTGPQQLPDLLAAMQEYVLAARPGSAPTDLNRAPWTSSATASGRLWPADETGSTNSPTGVRGFGSSSCGSAPPPAPPPAAQPPPHAPEDTDPNRAPWTSSATASCRPDRGARFWRVVVRRRRRRRLWRRPRRRSLPPLRTRTRFLPPPPSPPPTLCAGRRPRGGRPRGLCRIRPAALHPTPLPTPPPRPRTPWRPRRCLPLLGASLRAAARVPSPLFSAGCLARRAATCSVLAVAPARSCPAFPTCLSGRLQVAGVEHDP
jgi:hypothetical protein